jgi:hypothetical protein
MKKLLILGILFAFLIGCSTSKSGITADKKTTNPKVSDTVRIANEELEYEVMIIDSGFNSWLASTARPRGYHSESYLEGRNQIYVREWNSRVMEPQRYNPNLYEMRINYEQNVHYGYEVNYLIYNYFIYFQLQYKQQLSGFVPRQ